MLSKAIKRLSRRSKLLAIATCLTVAWGCGTYHPLRPTAMTPGLMPPPPQPSLARYVAEPPQDPPSVSPSPVEIIDETVTPEAGKIMRGGRYELTFRTGSVETITEVKLTEADTTKILFELEPHGAQFPVPVLLVIDYAGTNADPKSPSYDGSSPILFWFDNEKGVWSEVPGITDHYELKHLVELRHFSTYTLAGGKDKHEGKGGW